VVPWGVEEGEDRLSDTHFGGMMGWVMVVASWGSVGLGWVCSCLRVLLANFQKEMRILI
jgi:hypothetical protein